MNKMVNGSLVKMTDDEVAEFNARQSASNWLENRLDEYPTLDECLHAILDNDLDAIQTKRAAVKAKYPKG
tara:strand:+ start:17331 stop:17540 length:210 start_codon:yes stop_codon:yes gene_type:complete